MLFRVMVLVALSAQAFGQYEDELYFGGSDSSQDSSSFDATLPSGPHEPTPVLAVLDNCQCLNSCPANSRPSLNKNEAKYRGCRPPKILCCGTQRPQNRPFVQPTPTRPPIQQQHQSHRWPFQYPLTEKDPLDGRCGVRKIPPQPQPILGQASFGAYPWTAAVVDQTGRLVATGALIDEFHVITVASKIYPLRNVISQLKIHLGSWDSLAKDSQYTVSAYQAIIHPKFKPNQYDHDIAVIRLSDFVPIALYKNINTACLPTSGTFGGTRCYVSGWGKNLDGPQGAYQRIMREVDLPVMEGHICYQKIEKMTGLARPQIADTFVCAGGEPGKGTCEGDEGSPLVCQGAHGQWIVVGLMSWSTGCGEPGVPGVFTDIFVTTSWIKQAISYFQSYNK